MPYKMYIDDIRNPPDRTWVVVRSVEAATSYIALYGYPSFISFDHDLGLKLRIRDDDSIILIADGAEDVEAPSGFDFAKWLVNQDLDTNWMDAGFAYQVHSANPVGAANIRGLLDQYLSYRR